MNLSIFSVHTASWLNFQFPPVTQFTVSALNPLERFSSSFFFPLLIKSFFRSLRQYSKNCPRYSAIFLINDEIKNKERKAKDNSLEREDTNDDDPIGDDIGDLKEEREYSINQFYELIRSPQTELACFAVKILFHGACKRRRKSCNVYVLFTEHTTGPFISPNFKRASISIRFTIERSRPSTYVPSTEEERPLLKTEREKGRKDQPDWSTLLSPRYIFYRHSKNIPFLVPPLISDRSFLLYIDHI